MLLGMPVYRVISRQPLALAAHLAAIMASGGHIAPRVWGSCCPETPAVCNHGTQVANMGACLLLADH